MVFCKRYVFDCFALIWVFDFSKHSVTFDNMHPLNCWFHCVDSFCNEFRFCEIFKFKNSVKIQIIFFIKILHKSRTIICWSTFSVNSNVSSFLTYFLCVSQSFDFCIVAIKNIWNMYTVSTNQIEDTLHFSNRVNYTTSLTLIWFLFC